MATAAPSKGPRKTKVGTVTKIQGAVPTPQRGRWLRTVGLTSWDEILDGGAYQLELPTGLGLDELNQVIETIRQAVRSRHGTAKSLNVERKSDTVAIVQMVDR